MLYTQSLTPLNVPVAVIQPGQSFSLDLRKVCANAPVRLRGNFSIGAAGIVTVLIDVQRNGSSIINGGRVLKSISVGTGGNNFYYPYTFEVVDANTNSVANYTFILTAVSDVVTVASAVTTAEVSPLLSVNQKFPPAGIPVTTILPGTRVTIPLAVSPAAKKPIHLSANLNFIFPLSNIDTTIDIVDDTGRSVIQGPQPMEKFPTGPIVGTVENSHTLDVVVTESSRSYTLILAASSASSATVLDYYCFSARVSDAATTQSFPPMTAPPSYTIPVDAVVNIPLKASIGKGPKQLFFTANYAYNTLNSTVLLYNIRRGSGDSLTDGTQILVKSPTDGLSDIFEINLSVLAVDPIGHDCDETYYIDLINTGFTVIDIDYFNFTVQLLRSEGRTKK